jgi:hypothetical protein
MEVNTTKVFPFVLAVVAWPLLAIAQIAPVVKEPLPSSSTIGSVAAVRSSNALPQSVDAPALRRQMTAFQGILTRELQQSFEQPFGLLQDVKGMYLSRYGVAFHMEVNLAPLRLLSMFDYRPYTEEELRRTRDAKLARIQQLKTKVSDLLLANVQELVALPQEQQIAVVVHLFNMPSERVEGLPSQLVIEVSRKALAEAKAGLLSAEELRKQVSFSEL